MCSRKFMTRDGGNLFLVFQVWLRFQLERVFFKDHPNGHVIAQCIFSRMDRETFLSLKSHLTKPESHIANYVRREPGVPIEYNMQPNDSLLDESSCIRIFRRFVKDDYIYQLVQNELNLLPHSLSGVTSLGIQFKSLTYSKKIID